jgi:hypothetical protein
MRRIGMSPLAVTELSLSAIVVRRGRVIPRFLNTLLIVMHR